MTLLLTDSYDHFTTVATSLGKWHAAGSNPSISAVGRFGTNGVTVFDVDQIQYAIPTPGDAFTVGMAVKFGAYGNSTSRIFSFVDSAGVEQCSLRQVTGAGLFTATRNGTVFATSTNVFPTDIWFYLEVQVTIADAGGTFVQRVNGVTDINFTGDTKNSTTTANASFLYIGATSGANGTDIIVDDLYVVDDAGAGPDNTFLGDVRVECLFPNGNGNSSQFDGSDSNQTDNYLLVDETTPNSDTDYVQSPDVGDKDTYTFGNMVSTTGTVIGVQALAWAEKTNAGTREFVTVARLSGTETDSLAHPLGVTYQYHKDIRTTKPGGGVWTITDINAAEFGPKVSN